VVCEVLDRKFVRYIAFDNDPAKAIEARNRGLPVFYGDVSRPEVLQNFHVGDARMVSLRSSSGSSPSSVCPETTNLILFLFLVSFLSRIKQVPHGHHR
jgi:voltage-gated potassium channel Kch